MVRSLKFDTFFISTVGISSTLLAVFLYFAFGHPDVSPFAWLVLVVGFDVAHVYATTFRTYFNLQRNPELNKYLILVPIFCFALAFALAMKSSHLFWSVLVYIAVFHFARQQIGFLRIYTKPEDRKTPSHILNEVFVYIFTLGSIFIWHLQGHKTFNWFTTNDFYYLDQFTFLKQGINIFILICFAICLLLNTYNLLKRKISVNAGLILVSTFVSWYFPIVYFNSDFIFTTANVLAHGIPYLALVWASEKKRDSPFTRLEFFIPLLLFAAFIEEALWDSFVWREHSVFFESFYFLPKLQDNSILMALALAVLICPQLTHYILDGFIWQRKYQDIK
jgi:hypothetical protein